MKDGMGGTAFFDVRLWLFFVPFLLVLALVVVVIIKQRGNERVTFLKDRMRLSDANFLESLHEMEMPTAKEFAARLKKKDDAVEILYAEVNSWYLAERTSGRKHIAVVANGSDKKTVQLLKTAHNLAGMRQHLPEKETASRYKKTTTKQRLRLFAFPALVVLMLSIVFLVAFGVIQSVFITFLPLVTGLLFGALGVFGFFSEAYFRQKAQETEGVIVALKRRMVSTNSTEADVGYTWVTLPVVEYRVGGKTLREQSSRSVPPKRFHKGDTVTVRYIPEEPEDFRIAEAPGMTLWQIFFLVFGLAMLALGIFLLVVLWP